MPKPEDIRKRLDALPAKRGPWRRLQAWLQNDGGYEYVREKMAAGVELQDIAQELNAMGFRRADGSDLHGPALSSVLYRMAKKREGGSAAKPPRRQTPPAEPPKPRPAPEFRILPKREEDQ